MEQDLVHEEARHRAQCFGAFLSLRKGAKSISSYGCQCAAVQRAWRACNPARDAETGAKFRATLLGLCKAKWRCRSCCRALRFFQMVLNESDEFSAVSFAVPSMRPYPTGNRPSQDTACEG